MLPTTPHFILGSGSPRRKELLKDAGFQFNVVSVAVDESIIQNHQTPLEVVEYLSLKKLQAYTDWLDHKLVLTADTLVFKEDEILGKPENKDQALDMLNKLADNSHFVSTSVCLGYADNVHQFSVTTKVFFAPLSESQMLYYINRYKPYDKAGSYGIQEWLGHIGIKRIEGSYTNVMGLPMHETYHALISMSEKWIN